MEDLVLGAEPCPEQGAKPCSEAPLLGGFGFGGETLNGTTRRHPCLEDLVLGAKPCPEAPLLGGFGFGGETLIGTMLAGLTDIR